MNIRTLRNRLLCGAASIRLLAAPAAAAPIQYAQLPPPVQKGIAAQMGSGSKLGEIDRDEESGEVTYTIEIIKGARSIDCTLDANGSLLSVEVTLAETPPAVQKAIQGQVGPGALESIDKTFEEGKVGYDVDWKSKDGAEHSFSLDDGGKLSSVQLAPQELPPAVQASMVKEIDPAKIKDIEKTFDDNTVLYEITFDKDGVERAITYEESGRMESRQVLLTEVPPPVQNTIKQSVGPGQVVGIEHVFEKKKGASSFEVEAAKDGKTFYFSVGPKGAFLGME
jgi:uncharacterized membrane protein YkoI